MKRKVYSIVVLTLVFVFAVFCMIGCKKQEPQPGEPGQDGKSAYELAVDKGYTGTEEEWLQSLVGAKGNDGADGANGKSAYELAVEKGYTGTESEWLASLVGASGSNGKSAYELAVENGYEGDLASWLLSLVGQKGDKGDKGDSGVDGKSAYEIAVSKGYTGTEEEWLASLKGQDLTACEHAWSAWTDEFAADCTSIGTQTRTCSKCNAVERKIVAAVGHDWTFFQTVVEKTCTQDGIAYFDCSDCGVMQLRVDKAIGHVLETHAAQQNSCTRVGWKEYQTCKNCDYTTYEELPMLSHDVADGVCTMCKKAYQTDGFTFKATGYSGNYSVTGVETQTADRLIIPSTTPEGYPVTEIAQEAFANTDYIEVIIPDSVTSINKSAFSGCRGLTSITIPNSVTTIGDYAFVECIGLTSIEVVAGNTEYHSQDNCIIETASNTLILGCQNSVIPSDGSVTSIGSSAFNGCSGLTSVTIGSGVTTIGDGAFYGCSGLTSVTIPDSVTSIGSSAFRGCGGLTSVIIGNGVTSIGSQTFVGCSGLTSVIWNAENCISAGSFFYQIFSNCTNLITVTIGNNVKTIPSYAFYGCSGLTSIEIPDSVTSIGSYAFAYCSGLTSVTIPDSVTSIDKSAFRGCSGLTSIEVVAGNTKYHSQGNCLIETASKTLILGCQNSVIPADGSVTSIGSYAFV